MKPWLLVQTASAESDAHRLGCLLRWSVIPCVVLIDIPEGWYMIFQEGGVV